MNKHTDSAEERVPRPHGHHLATGYEALTTSAPMNNPEIQCAKIAELIIDGCNKYLEGRTKYPLLDAVFHGEEGIKRALRAQKYAVRILESVYRDSVYTLALLYAIYQTRSQALALCIADKLITGKKEIFTLYNTQTSTFTGELTSDVFNKDLLNAALTSNLTFGTYGLFGVTKEFDKVTFVRKLLNTYAKLGFEGTEIAMLIHPTPLLYCALY